MKLAKCKCGWEIIVGDRLKAVKCPKCGEKIYIYVEIKEKEEVKPEVEIKPKIEEKVEEEEVKPKRKIKPKKVV